MTKFFRAKKIIGLNFTTTDQINSPCNYAIPAGAAASWGFGGFVNGVAAVGNAIGEIASAAPVVVAKGALALTGGVVVAGTIDALILDRDGDGLNDFNGDKTLTSLAAEKYVRWESSQSKKSQVLHADAGGEPGGDNSPDVDGAPDEEDPPIYTQQQLDSWLDAVHASYRNLPPRGPGWKGVIIAAVAGVAVTVVAGAIAVRQKEGELRQAHGAEKAQLQAELVQARAELATAQEEYKKALSATKLPVANTDFIKDPGLRAKVKNGEITFEDAIGAQALKAAVDLSTDFLTGKIDKKAFAAGVKAEIKDDKLSKEFADYAVYELTEALEEVRKSLGGGGDVPKVDPANRAKLQAELKLANVNLDASKALVRKELVTVKLKVADPNTVTDAKIRGKIDKGEISLTDAFVPEKLDIILGFSIEFLTGKLGESQFIAKVKKEAEGAGLGPDLTKSATDGFVAIVKQLSIKEGLQVDPKVTSPVPPKLPYDGGGV